MLLAGSGMVEYSRLTPEVRDKLVETINAVAPRFDRVLLDTGAGISDVVLYTVSLADEVIVVVTPEPTSMTDAYATIKVLASTQKRRAIRVVVNQRVPGTDARGVTAQLQQVIDRYVSPGLEAPVRLELVGDVAFRRLGTRCRAQAPVARRSLPRLGGCAGHRRHRPQNGACQKLSTQPLAPSAAQTPCARWSIASTT